MDVGHARRRLPDDPGLRGRGGHGHQRLPDLRALGRPGDGPRHRRQHPELKPGETARADYLHWAWQIKFEAAKNVAHHVDKMLHACGGSGYKRDMELERYVRDAKAGWVMGPTNEVLRQFVGKAVLLGFDALDYWNQTYNRRVVENEIKKLDAGGQARARRAAASPRPRRTRPRSPPRHERDAPPAGPQAASTRRWESHWVRPGGATVVKARPTTGSRSSTPTAASPAELCVLTRARGRRRWGRGRRAGLGAARPGRVRARRRLPRRAPPAGLAPEEARASGCSRRRAARRLAGLPRRARGDGGRRRAGRARRGRRPARLGAGGRGPPRGPAHARGGRAPAAAGRAAAGPPGRQGERAGLRGPRRRVHPGHRRRGPPVLGLPRLPRGEAPGRGWSAGSTPPSPAR